MRISDWSSDVCSSDLFRLPHRRHDGGRGGAGAGRAAEELHASDLRPHSTVLEAPRRWQATVSERSSASQPGARATVPPSAAWSTACRRASPLRRKTRSEEHTSELQSLMRNSYAVFCLKK